MSDENVFLRKDVNYADPAAVPSMPGDTAIRNRASMLQTTTIAIPKLNPNQNSASQEEEVVHKQLKIFCHACSQKLDVTMLEPFTHFTCPSCGADLIVPKWFDDYLLEEPGGIGGMATVYRALDLALDREVAIKVLRSDIANDHQRSELFLNEARTAATINHYAVVPIYTCGVSDGQTYIIMQYMGGGSLEMQLKISRGMLPVKEVIRWIRDIAEGLENANLHGIIHHDIKPGNILLDQDGNAKIGDFGIAQIVNGSEESSVSKLTKTWISPHYVSPEKVLYGKEDYRGDIYSLGATLYQLVTGFTPFNHNDVNELVRMRINHDPIPPHLQRAEVSPVLSRLILSMMERDPAQRPSYQEISKGLASILKGDEGSVLPKETPKKSAAHHAKGKQFTLQRDSADARPSGYSRVQKTGIVSALISTIILLLVVCGGSYYAWAQGFLHPYLSFLPDPKVAVEPMTDLIPEISLAFSLGNPSGAAEFCALMLDQPDITPERRNQAGTQLALAYYLSALPDAPQRCAQLLEKLQSIVPGMTPDNLSDLPPVEGAAVDIVKFLGTQDLSDADLRITLDKATPDYRVAGELAVFLRSLYRKSADSVQLKSELRPLMEAISALPVKSWPYTSFVARLPFWKQVIDERTGIKSDLEPLFASLVEKEEAWKFVKPDASKLFGGFVLPESSKQILDKEKEKTNAPADLKNLRITEEDIAKAVAAYVKDRPTPLSPAAITSAEMKQYLMAVPAAQRGAESARAGILLETKAFVAKMMLKIPYEADNFSSITQNLGAGVLMGNPQYVSFRSSAGKRTRLSWSQIPAEEFMRIIHFYAKIREDALRDSHMNSPANKKVLAWDYLRLAVLAAWYGNHMDAMQAAKKAIQVDPSVAGDVYRLLLI